MRIATRSTASRRSTPRRVSGTSGASSNMAGEIGMTRFLISRVLSLAFVMWLVTVIAFVVIRLAPGDPSATMLGADATPQAVAEFRANYELDGPIPVQYFAWLGHVARGDL